MENTKEQNKWEDLKNIKQKKKRKKPKENGIKHIIGKTKRESINNQKNDTGKTKIKTKICTKCKIEKLLCEFHKNKYNKDGYQHYCKKCRSGRIIENFQDGYKRCVGNKISCNIIKPLNEFAKGRNQCKMCRKNQKKQWDKENEVHVKQYNKKYDDEHKKERKIIRKQYRKKYKKEIRKYDKIWRRKNYKNNLTFKLKCSMRTILKRMFDLIGTKKKGRTNDILGYSPEKLKQRLEVNFTDGMSWNNYGKLKDRTWGWEIDHIISFDYFKKKGITDPKIINMLCNLKPRWKISRIVNGVFYLGNIEKSNKESNKHSNL